MQKQIREIWTSLHEALHLLRISQVVRVVHERCVVGRVWSRAFVGGLRAERRPGAQRLRRVRERHGLHLHLHCRQSSSRHHRARLLRWLRRLRLVLRRRERRARARARLQVACLASYTRLSRLGLGQHFALHEQHPIRSPFTQE